MKKSIAWLALSLMAAFIVFGFTSCLSSEAQEPQIYKASINNVGFQCRSMGSIANCGAYLYDCTDGSFRRFDVVCATNVTVEK